MFTVNTFPRTIAVATFALVASSVAFIPGDADAGGRGGGVGIGGVGIGAVRSFHAVRGFNRPPTLGPRAFFRGGVRGIPPVGLIPPQGTDVVTTFGARAVISSHGKHDHGHRRHVRTFGWGLPWTTAGDAAFLGSYYDPTEVVPIEVPVEDMTGLPPGGYPGPTALMRPPRSGDACTTEKVTVPSDRGGGSREVNIIRC
jgi:hypothetical protein